MTVENRQIQLPTGARPVRAPVNVSTTTNISNMRFFSTKWNLRFASFEKKINHYTFLRVYMIVPMYTVAPNEAGT